MENASKALIIAGAITHNLKHMKEIESQDHK